MKGYSANQVFARLALRHVLACTAIALLVVAHRACGQESRNPPPTRPAAMKMPMPSATGTVTTAEMEMGQAQAQRKGQAEGAAAPPPAGTNVPNRSPVSLNQAERQLIDIRTHAGNEWRCDGDDPRRWALLPTTRRALPTSTRASWVGHRSSTWISPANSSKSGAPHDETSTARTSTRPKTNTCWPTGGYRRCKMLPGQDDAQTNNVVWQESLTDAQALMESVPQAA